MQSIELMKDIDCRAKQTLKTIPSEFSCSCPCTPSVKARGLQNAAAFSSACHPNCAQCHCPESQQKILMLDEKAYLFQIHVMQDALALRMMYAYFVL